MTVPSGVPPAEVYRVRLHLHRGTKTLTITEDAYERLNALKRDDESVSDVVNRITGEKLDVWKGFGRYDGADGDRLRAAVEAGREEMDREMEERAEGVAKALEEHAGEE